MSTATKSMFEVMEALNKRMAAFESDLHKSPPVSTTDTLAADFNAFKAFTVQVLRAFQQQLSGLAHEVDQQEMRSRRKILLFHGVPEDKKEQTSDVITKVITTKLKMSDFNTQCISRCQRMGRASQDRPRPLLVKFKEIIVRDKVWFAKTNLKGTGITLSEFLTKTRHEAFMAARQRFGLNKCWTRDGYVHILGADGARHRVSNLEELHKIALPMTPESSKPVAAKEAKEPLPTKTRRAAVAATKK